jgi:hypothetical protein
MMHTTHLCNPGHAEQGAAHRVDAMSRTTPSEDTAARLQGAEHAAVPLLIPGAYEQHARQAAAPPVDVAAPSASGQATRLQATPGAAVDRERLEHEREGGGAPSQRKNRGGPA